LSLAGDESAFTERKGVARLTDIVAARWADLLVDYCLRVERGETIVLSSSVLAQPLVEACFKAIVEQGGHPLLRLEIPGLHEYFLEHAGDAQLSYLPPEALFEWGRSPPAGRV
jgi:aminopeptidase